MAEVKEARVESRWRVSAVWLFPVITLIGGCYLAYDYFANRGELIFISFREAANVEPVKTKLRYRGVQVGEVEGIHLSSDFAEVIVDVRLSKGIDHLAREGSIFSLVQPQVGFQGVEGLETLVTGPYINVEPGEGKARTTFEGKDFAVGEGTAETVSYFLSTPHADSLDIKDPLRFRGIKIGEITSINFSPTGQTLRVEVSVQKQFVTLIRSNSVFWISTGVEADLGFLGAEIKIPSMETLVSGGITVSTPGPAGAVAKAEAEFPLRADAPENWRTWSAKLQLND